MKNSLFICALFICFLTACSRETNGIWVKLEQPMFNRFDYRGSGGEAMMMELEKSGVTNIYDMEQMTTVGAKIRGGDVTYRRSRFRIALIDYNNNGLFNEAGMDKFLLERYGQDTSVLIYPLKPNLSILQPYTQFRVDRQFFEVVHIDEQGHSLEIYPISRSDALKPTIFNTRLPNIKLRDREGIIHPLSDLQEEGKPMVIILWQNKHHIWDARIEKLIKAHQENPELMTLIGIHIPGNYFRRTSIESIDGWLKNRMPLYWGETKDALELNNGDQFPGIILFDDEGIWQGSGMWVEEVLAFLKN